MLGLVNTIAEYIDRMSPTLPAHSHRQSWMAGIASQCAVCRSWPAKPVCSDCMARFMPATARCTTCALPMPPQLPKMHGLQQVESLTADLAQPICADCMRQAAPLDSALAAVAYAYPWSGLISRYKFGQQPGWAGLFAGMLLATPGVVAALAKLTKSDWLIPLPLSAERLEERGFNQAWELASALARQSQTHGRADARMLLRLRNTVPQSSLRREARLANMRGAFLVDPLRAAELAGRRVVLVDDVMTSGATVFAAAEALRSAGAAHITAVVLARTAA